MTNPRGTRVNALALGVMVLLASAASALNRSPLCIPLAAAGVFLIVVHFIRVRRFKRYDQIHTFDDGPPVERRPAQRRTPRPLLIGTMLSLVFTVGAFAGLFLGGPNANFGESIAEFFLYSAGAGSLVLTVFAGLLAARWFRHYRDRIIS